MFKTERFGRRKPLWVHGFLESKALNAGLPASQKKSRWGSSFDPQRLHPCFVIFLERSEVIKVERDSLLRENSV